MTELLVYQLEFTDKNRLEEAFGLLLDQQGVDGCAIEASTMTARFMAAKSVGGPLVERLYGVGGLCWCSRHTIRTGGG